MDDTHRKARGKKDQNWVFLRNNRGMNGMKASLDLAQSKKRADNQIRSLYNNGIGLLTIFACIPSGQQRGWNSHTRYRTN